MKNDVIISIIMPFYNHHDFVFEALNSFRNQTYKDFELIVIDDCSDVPFDKKGMKFYDFPYIFLRHKKNFGVAQACNSGIELSNGDYIQIFGADDIANPWMLESNLKALKADGRRWATGGMEYIALNGRINSQSKIDHVNDENILTVVTNGGGLACGSCLYEKSLYSEIGIYNTELRQSEDRDFWQRLLLADHFPAYVRKCQYQWRQGSSRTRTNKFDGSWEKWKKIRDSRA